MLHTDVTMHSSNAAQSIYKGAEMPLLVT